MLIRNIETGIESELREVYPNASLPEDIDAFLSNEGYERVIEPPYIPTPEELVEQARQQVIWQLNQLDLKCPRGLEDYYTASGFDVTTLPLAAQEVLVTKNELRSQL